MRPVLEQNEEFAKWWGQWVGRVRGLRANARKVTLPARDTQKAGEITQISKAIGMGILLLCSNAWTQQQRLPNEFCTVADVERTSHSKPPVIPPVLVQPRMSAEQVLRTYERRAAEQVFGLSAHSDTTIVDAELPNSNQRGRCELKRDYVAPKTMNFTPVCFVGDDFAKSNVIIRLLQLEANHVSKQRGAETALTNQNYRFSFKGTEYVDGRTMYVFHVKPRHKRDGLFKGRVLIDPYTGNLFRVQGTLVKSPSWFVKKTQFVQEYAQIGTFTLPVYLHSISNVRIIGRTVVDVFHFDYEAQVAAPDTIPADYAGR